LERFEINSKWMVQNFKSKDERDDLGKIYQFECEKFTQQQFYVSTLFEIFAYLNKWNLESLSRLDLIDTIQVENSRIYPKR
jgi:thymidylate synthase